MLLRKLPIAATLVATAALAAAGCGSDSAGEAAIDVTAARTAVEKAAHVKLSKTELVKDGTKYGVLGTFANLGDVVTDKQMVMLLVLDEADKAAMVREQIEASLPAGAEALEHENAVVFYASQGTDRSNAIDKALAAL